MASTHIMPLFINSHDMNDIKASSQQRIVRSHVARCQWDNYKRVARKKNARQQFLPFRVELNIQFEEDTSRTKDNESASIPRLLGGCRVDPFHSYPVWRPYFPLIIDHYLVSMAVDIPELDEPSERGLLRTRWFPLAISDRALFLVIILLAASHYASLRKCNNLKVDLLQLRYEAVRSINQELEANHQAIDDALIGAVAKMASYEAMFGTLDAYNMHMRGLSLMVSLRGGLPSLGLNGLLRRIVIWIDRNSAFLLKSELYFPGVTLRVPDPNPGCFLGVS